MDWLKYLPPVLQDPETYFTLLVCFAVYGLAKSYVKADKFVWIPETAAMAVGIGVACGLDVGKSYVYSVGVGFIAAWGASSFYTTAFFWLTSKIRGLIGAPVSLSEPLQLPPQINTPPKTNP